MPTFGVRSRLVFVIGKPLPNVRDFREMDIYAAGRWLTCDDSAWYLFIDDGIASIPFAFHRETHHDPTELGEVFLAELSERELMSILHQTAWALADDHLN